MQYKTCPGWEQFTGIKREAQACWRECIWGDGVIGKNGREMEDGT